MTCRNADCCVDFVVAEAEEQNGTPVRVVSGRRKTSPARDYFTNGSKNNEETKNVDDNHSSQKDETCEAQNTTAPDSICRSTIEKDQDATNPTKRQVPVPGIIILCVLCFDHHSATYIGVSKHHHITLMFVPGCLTYRDDVRLMRLSTQSGIIPKTGTSRKCCRSKTADTMCYSWKTTPKTTSPRKRFV